MEKRPTPGEATALTGGGVDSSHAGTICGKAARIADGAAFTLLRDEHSPVDVRLAEIDAPGAGQPWSEESREALESLIDGKTVEVEVQNVDGLGRLIARVFTVNLDVSAEMVWMGHAMVNRQYVRDSSFFALEEDAKRNRRGLWSQSE